MKCKDCAFSFDDIGGMQERDCRIDHTWKPEDTACPINDQRLERLKVEIDKLLAQMDANQGVTS